ncbi:MAG TPA: FecR domain-containing protein, partial [Planctomycetaceae bacterium]
MLRTSSDPHFGGLDSSVALEATAHSATETITIPNPDLLFSGDFKRAGNDLILSDEKQKFVVHDYFKFDKQPTLLSPRGAAITPDVVQALAGPLAPGQYAQATAAPAAAQAIGAVVTVSGNVVAIRNGVSITLNAGDAILKGDVLQTGGDGAIAVTFNDGATFNLGADARIVLSEFVYDPNSVANSSVVNLIRGQLSFISGQIAHTGDMKVVTPVATMGIRGTVGIVSQGDTLSLTVANQGDGVVHAIDIRDSSGNLIGRATSVGGTWNVSAVGGQQVAGQEVARQVTQQQELNIVGTLLNQQATGYQIVQQLQQAQQQDTKSTETHGSSTVIQTTDHKSSSDGVVKITISNSTTGDTTTKTDVVIKDVVVDTFIQQEQITVTTNPAPLFVGGTALTRLGVPSAGLPGAIDALAPDASADGRFVAFMSMTEVPNGGSDHGKTGDVYLYDRQSNTTTAITHAANGVSYSGVSISQDGRFVVYQTEGISGQSGGLYVYDRLTNTSSLVQHSSG